MPPLVTFILGFLTAAAVAWLFRRRGMRTIRGLKQEKEELLTEESRMFSFLHEIGQNLAHDRGHRRLYEDIVQGVMRVISADSAALYLLDPRTGTDLIPVALTPGAPALIEIPEKLASESSATLHSYLQLTAVPADAGLLGKCFTSQAALTTGPLIPGINWPGRIAPSQAGMSVMLAPVTNGSRRLGVLGAIQEAGKEPFSHHEFEVFRSAAEQCAFALASAMTQQEAMDKRRIEEELRSASEVQRILLPQKAPELGDYLIAATNTPAKVMSGDYYDFIQLDENHLGVVIADVSGKGIPASLVMATCRALLRGLAQNELSPALTLSRVNRRLWGDVREDMFISLAYCVLDRTSPQIVMARAGHDAPLLFSRATGSISPLKPPGLAIGVDSGKVFERATKDHTFFMESGDCLLLYTDGINEAMNAEGDEFGLERLTETFRQSAPRGAQAVLDAFQKAVKDFAGSQPQNDDITLIVVQKK
ncbi:MAG TPA: GAF domain-containing SpoIIE family protein phosphatase [Verrucomicrobiales bacterium]|nr:GAF domain-containing SpoIIE family protein phosphatase [Verrucomicrobiales bacterium]